MSTPAGIVCTPLIDVNTLLQPLLMKSVFQEEGEIPLDQVFNIIINDKITQSLLGGVTLPAEFADLGNVICLQLETQKVRAVSAMLRGETPPEFDISKTFELVINLQMISSLSQAFTTV